MKFNYDFYITDGSFDYGDFDYVCNDYHGFSIDIDKNNFVDITSLDAYGDYEEMNSKCKTLSSLRDYIIEHLNEIKEFERFSKYTNIELFKELISFINDSLGGVA